jgi:hypothetical protein
MAAKVRPTLVGHVRSESAQVRCRTSFAQQKLGVLTYTSDLPGVGRLAAVRHPGDHEGVNDPAHVIQLLVVVVYLRSIFSLLVSVPATPCGSVARERRVKRGLIRGSLVFRIRLTRIRFSRVRVDLR